MYKKTYMVFFLLGLISQLNKRLDFRMNDNEKTYHRRVGRRYVTWNIASRCKINRWVMVTFASDWLYLSDLLVEFFKLLFYETRTSANQSSFIKPLFIKLTLYWDNWILYKFCSVCHLHELVYSRLFERINQSMQLYLFNTFELNIMQWSLLFEMALRPILFFTFMRVRIHLLYFC